MTRECSIVLIVISHNQHITGIHFTTVSKTAKTKSEWLSTLRLNYIISEETNSKIFTANRFMNKNLMYCLKIILCEILWFNFHFIYCQVTNSVDEETQMLIMN